MCMCRLSLRADTSIFVVQASQIASFVDVGGIMASLLAGMLVDWTGKPAMLTCGMLGASIPLLWVFDQVVLVGDGGNTGASKSLPAILIITALGLFITGPYSLIRTAVAATLGSSPTLSGRRGGVAMTTGVIECAGTVGATLAGVLGSLETTVLIWLLMGCCMAAIVCLVGALWRELFAHRSLEREVWDKVRQNKSLASISIGGF